MTSFVGLSSAARQALEEKGRKLTGPLVVTLHKASHLKNIVLSSAGTSSALYAVLSVGGGESATAAKAKDAAGRGTVHQSVVRRGAGPHPQWEQQFLFWLGEEGPEGAAPPSACTGPHDGSLHVRVYDRAQGDELVGRLDVNFIQLLVAEAQDASANGTADADARPMSPPAAKPAPLPAGSVTRWLPLTDRTDLRATVGWLCISATFKGKGLETSAAEQATPEPSAAAENGLSEQLQQQSLAATAAPVSEVFTLLTSPKSSAPSIVLELPNALLAQPVSLGGGDSGEEERPRPPPADAAAYNSAPGAEWPLPQPNPPAPGYPASRPGTSYARERFAQLQTVMPVPPPPAAAVLPGSGASKEDAALAAAASAATQAAESAQATLVTAFDHRHDHILQLLPRLPAGRFLCASCAGEGHAAAWHCGERGCHFDLHEECLREEEQEEAAEEEEEEEEEAASHRAAPELRVDRRHAHPLVWKEHLYEGAFLCSGCGGGGSGPAWHCRSCAYDLHPECMR